MDLILFSFVSTLLTMDAVILGQFGFSRPIVCASIAGYLLGDIKLGLSIGIILELIWINTIPIGTTLVPDVSASALLATYWAGLMPKASDAAIVLSLIFALPVGLIFKKTDLMLRRHNSSWNKKIEAAVEAGDSGIIARATMLAIFMFCAKNFLLFLFALQGYRILFWIFNILYEPLIDGLAAAYKFLPAVGIGVFLFNFYDSVPKVIKKRN